MTKKTRFIKPVNYFKQKVGTGGIDESLLDKAQNMIQNNKIDFAEYAIKYIEDLDKVIETSKSEDKNDQEKIKQIIKPIMQLKANGGMFKYHLVSEIADIILNFLEDAKTLDNDVYKVIDVHKNTLQAIVANKLKGDGGKEGYNLSKELSRACNRYHKKHNA